MIKESELILKEGRVYHLGLSKDELADTIITVGDPQRVTRVTMHFDQVDTIVQNREFITHTGRIGNKRISVIGTGIGPDNIDIMINEADALKNINFETRRICDKLNPLTIIRMGTSGSLQADIDVDDILISSHGFGIDGLMNFYDYPKSAFQKAFLQEISSKFPQLLNICIPTIFEADKHLLESFPIDWHRGMTITAGGFYGPQGRELRLKQFMRPVIDQLTLFNFRGHRFCNFEMETSAIYGLARLLGHRAMSINAIVANRVQKTYSQKPQETIDRMIKNALEVIVEKDL